MNVTLFNKVLTIPDCYCQLNDEPPLSIEEPYINLYVQSKGCNANCRFCEYKNSARIFNFEKYDSFLSQLSSQIKVKKISFTGGEPTLDYYELLKRVKLAKKYFPDAFIVVNTNGLYFEKLIKSNAYSLFDSIALSRHHYSDYTNNTIFKTETIRMEDIKNLLEQVDSSRFHLSCNVIKGAIDSKEQVYNYLSYANYMGFTDVGFVGLMPINKYAEDHYINFKGLDVESERLVKIKDWKREDKCKCSNYLYIPNNLNIIKVYHRHVCSGSSDNNFTFNGENFSKGFNGEIIY